REVGVDIMPTAMRRNPVHPSNAAAVYTLLRRARRWHPDVIHTHATIGGFLGRGIHPLVGVPVVHTQNGALFADPDGRYGAAAGRMLERVLRHFTDVVIATSES